MSNKLVLLAFLVIAMYGSTAHSSSVDEEIYNAIEKVLKLKYSDEPATVECMMKYMREHNVADQFKTSDLLFDQEKLAKNLTPIVEEAEKSCKSNHWPFIVGGVLIGIGILISLVVYFFKKS